MKIAITGYSGLLGSMVMARSPSQLNFLRLGRDDFDVYWRLGTLPDPMELQNVDAIIHFAWATKNRKLNYHTNIGGSIQLANLARDLDCPFLFVSSTGINSDSLYGKSKLLAEKGVTEAGGEVLRLGLVPFANPYTNSRGKYFQIYPHFKNLIPVTESDSLMKFILLWIENCQDKNSNRIKIKTLVDDFMNFSNLTNSKWKMPIPEKLIEVALSTLKPLNFRIYDLHDALKTITTQGDL